MKHSLRLTFLGLGIGAGGGAIVHGMRIMEWNRMGGIYWNEGKASFSSKRPYDLVNACYGEGWRSGVVCEDGGSLTTTTTTILVGPGQPYSRNVGGLMLRLYR